MKSGFRPGTDLSLADASSKINGRFGLDATPRAQLLVPERIDPAVAAAIDHLNNNRRRSNSHQMTGEPVKFAKRRVVKVAGQEQRLEISGGDSNTFYVTYLDGANTPGKTVEIVSSWRPGDSVWEGRVGGAHVAIQVRPVLNRVTLDYRGIRALTYVYTEREAHLAMLMLDKVTKLSDTSTIDVKRNAGSIVKSQYKGDVKPAEVPVDIESTIKPSERFAA